VPRSREEFLAATEDLLQCRFVGCQWPFILPQFWPIKLTRLRSFNSSFSASVDSSLLPA
jgi:hypothetical protein